MGNHRGQCANQFFQFNVLKRRRTKGKSGQVCTHMTTWSSCSLLHSFKTTNTSQWYASIHSLSSHENKTPPKVKYKLSAGHGQWVSPRDTNLWQAVLHFCRFLLSPHGSPNVKTLKHYFFFFSKSKLEPCSSFPIWKQYRLCLKDKKNKKRYEIAAGNSNVQSGINYIDRIQREWGRGAQILYRGLVQHRTITHTKQTTLWPVACVHSSQCLLGDWLGPHAAMFPPRSHTAVNKRLMAVPDEAALRQLHCHVGWGRDCCRINRISWWSLLQLFMVQTGLIRIFCSILRIISQFFLSQVFFTQQSKHLPGSLGEMHCGMRKTWGEEGPWLNEYE